MVQTMEIYQFLKMRHSRGRKGHLSWADISREIKDATGVKINRSIISMVANGKRTPSNTLIDAVNKTYHKKFKHKPVTIIATPMKCGHVSLSKHCKICHPGKKTFEQNCIEYDEWLSSPTTQQQLAKMLKWAETPREKRQWTS